MSDAAPDPLADGCSPVHVATPDIARAALARWWLGPAERHDAGVRLGTVMLRPHQLDAVAQLQPILAAQRGAVLADAVGLGKTYVALALARLAHRPLIISPAGLRSMWERACADTGVAAAWQSMEALSRHEDPTLGPPAFTPDFVIVDEAHHFRNPSTRRYRALVTRAGTARLLLLSATPIHNCAGDLAALLALFLGARAWTLDDERRARYVVRRTHAVAGTLDDVPAVSAPEWLDTADDSDTLRDLVALPAPVPPSDGGDGGALLVHGLVRQWASSRGALHAALRRQLARGVALASALEHGRYPAYRDLRSWCVGDGAVQLAFPELLLPETTQHEALRAAVDVHAAAIRALLARLARRPDPDLARTERIRELRQRHRTCKIVAFSAYEETVRTFYRHLRQDGGVGVLRAAGAEVAGGRLTRCEAVARFAPRANAAPAPRAAERIDLLLTTDLLSEGVNLQDASVVVHLDLPWTPARLEQRVGRAARLGSSHRHIAVYALCPPAGADQVLGVERRLKEKLSAAGHAVGVVGSIVPGQAGLAHIPQGAPHHAAAARATIARWRTESSAAMATGDSVSDGPPLCAAVSAAADGFLAACVVRGKPVLLASLDGGATVTDAAELVARAADLANGPAAPVDITACTRAIAAVRAWGRARQAARDAGVDGDATGGTAPARRRIITRIAAITRAATPWTRPRIAALATAARRAATTPGNLSAERALDTVADTPLPDESWLRAVASLGTPYDRNGHNGDCDTGGVHVHVVLLLVL